MRSLVAVAVLAGACSMGEDAWVEKFTKADCEYALACFDADVLTFKGWTDEDACFDDHAPDVAGRGVGCVYDPAAARACVKEMKARECPGTDQEHVEPQICASVYTSCGTVDTEDSGA